MADEIGVINRQMADTRNDLGNKAEALEEQVVSTVKDTASAVSETVGNVKETVQQTTQAVADTVKSVTQSLDISSQVRNHPWLMVGGGFALGYLLNCLLSKPSSSQSETTRRASQRKSQPAISQRATSQWGTSQTSQQSQGGQQDKAWSDALGAIWDSWGPLADKLKGMALGATTGVLGEVLLQYAPQALRNGLSDLINNLTQQVGGTVMRPQHEEQQGQQQHQQQGQQQQHHQEQHQPHKQEQHHQQQHHQETRTV